jgi:neuroligin
MVWIHGGGLTLGFGDQYDGGWIATEGNVIIVTINYRVNLFGFLSVGHPASKGNYGLWDHTITVNFLFRSSSAGTYTFKNKQSSDILRGLKSASISLIN